MSNRAVPWIVAGVAVAALAAVLMNVSHARPVPHPDPRPGITADRVMPAALVPHTPGAAEAYEAARNAPRTARRFSFTT